MIYKHFEGNIPRGGIARSYTRRHCQTVFQSSPSSPTAWSTLQAHGHILEDSEQYLTLSYRSLRIVTVLFQGE